MEPSAETVSSRVYGTFFFAGFGSWWLAMGLSVHGQILGSRLAGVVLLGLALVGAGVWLLRRARRLPSVPPLPGQRAYTKRVFLRVNLLQWTAIGVSALILSVLGHREFVIWAIALIVGLHLFPLARAFRYKPHYVTGAALVALCTACLVAVPRASLDNTVALGTGLILLASAAFTLGLCFRACATELAVARGV